MAAIPSAAHIQWRAAPEKPQPRPRGCALIDAPFRCAWRLQVIVWVGPMMALTFGVLKVAGLARVSADIERIGLDVSKHGVAATNRMTTRVVPVGGSVMVKPTAGDVQMFNDAKEGTV